MALQRPLRILEISSCFPPSRGGVETFVNELSKRLALKGHDLTVVTSSRGAAAKFHRERVGRLEVIRFPEKWHMFEAPLVPKIAMSVLTREYDVVHVNGLNPTISDLAILFAKLRRKPVVLTYHNDAATSKWGRLGNLAGLVYGLFGVLVVDLADVVVCSTRSYAQTSIVLKHHMDKLKIVPLGVNAPPEGSAGPPDHPERPERLLFVGQLKDYKGVHILLDALNILIGAGNDITLDVVGSGQEAERLEAQAERLGLGRRVRFHGDAKQEDLARFYHQCDLLVLPSVSRREAFGLVILEAFSAGKPVVASDIPGVNEVTTLGGGHLARPEDPLSLARAIGVALSTPDQAEKYREFARLMSWDVVTSKYESTFNELIAVKANSPRRLKQL